MPQRLLQRTLIIVFCLLGWNASAAEVRIGVLALRGEEKAMVDWQPLAEKLNQQIPEHHFSILPLDFKQTRLLVRQHRVDFIIANPAFYVELEKNDGITPVATMRTKGVSGSELKRYGGVIFTRADREDIQTLRDLKGRTLAAVDSASFGGWQIGWRELKHHAIDIDRDLERVEFIGTHDAVVYAVAEGAADVGIVRTGTLEKMAAEGGISLNDFVVLAPRHPAGFPYMLSTDLYPEWPIAKVSGVSEALAIKVAVALMQISSQDPSFQSSNLAGWTLPLNYQSVHDALKELEVGPYAYLREVSWQQVLEHYWYWLVIVTLLMVLLLSLAFYVLSMNQRLKKHHAELRNLNAGLENRVAERTEEIEGLMLHERLLRGVVETVADVNQIIITSDAEQQMLKAACDRLIVHPDYRFAWVGKLEGIPDEFPVEIQDALPQRLQIVGRSFGSAEQMRALLDTDEDSLALRSISANQSLQEQLPSVLLGCRSVVALPLRQDAFNLPFGVLVVFSEREEGFDYEEMRMLEQLAGDLGFAVHAFEQRNERIRLQQDRISNYEETILSMVDLIEQRDSYTAGHTQRVAEYSALIARQMELPEESVERLYRAAVLHDIGKIVIPDSVLLKPGKLTPLEYKLIQQHVTAGYQTLSKIKMYQDLAEIMRHHHEWIDGSGYPQGLKGEQIPLEGRIMAVADSFDAMTSYRIYKPRKSVETALQELNELAGRQYDEQVVAAAQVVLRNVIVEEDAKQLPQTEIEQQRFAYFFNDQLTGVYNENYLEFMLINGLDFQFKHAKLVCLHGFAELNQHAGWLKGNEVLKSVAEYLMGLEEEAIVFRVMGDDFVILSPADLHLDTEELVENTAMKTVAVSVDFTSLNVQKAEGLEQLKKLAGLE
ncbi:HD domain-containing phosphohydrolase [Thiomicrorhabdus xiamenensis]|uniref:PhnD/SsuA/transferrin family substrate-binding protein n=1 Tax=Thiomicrorhabdus xiamenensis TaxID=2739063 RepID=A0A7D4NRP6_9GAMM|nr:HD domain-containing phosphohydrolase [Thiomicrorhabdus xiamenensis]QKI89397.1 PhnD/SsuA/transferrin family substrate-binding protein [Thiomicrorhabdus xiamenensis]